MKLTNKFIFKKWKVKSNSATPMDNSLMSKINFGTNTVDFSFDITYSKYIIIKSKLSETFKTLT